MLCDWGGDYWCQDLSSVDLQPSSQAAATHCPSFNAVKSLFIHPYHRLQIKLIYHFWKLFWASLLVCRFLSQVAWSVACEDYTFTVHVAYFLAYKVLLVSLRC
uniref:Uncharacterized protein n=1 Tax=Helianthus annuus TaxID=4232 RepID=A0A251TQY4_HELAN